MLFLIILFYTIISTTIDYTLEIKYKWLTVNGFDKAVISVNGQNTGPVLRTSEGDILKVTVINLLFTKGITIHWHGMRLPGVPYMDGTAGITQCTINPNNNMTYEFVTDRFGTYWYHGHVESQRDDAFYGPLIVDNVKIPLVYDYEYIILISDFYHSYSDAQILMLKSHPYMWVGPPQYILVNGLTNYNMTVVHNKTYLIRFIMATADSYVNISIPGHNVSIVEIEGTYTVPFFTSNLWINVGERYTVLLHANNPGCYNINISGLNNNASGSVGLLYANCLTKPISKINTKVFDTNLITNLYPGILPMPNKKLTMTFGMEYDAYLGKTYSLNNISFEFPPMPILLSGYLQHNLKFNNATQIIPVNFGDVIDITIINHLHQHPFHIHGHSFYVICVGNISNIINPINRDTITVPENTTVVIRIVFDNPGIWLAHCHSTWHMIMGMALVFAYPLDTIPLPSTSFEICGKNINRHSEKQYVVGLILVIFLVIIIACSIFYIYHYRKKRGEEMQLM